MRHWVVFGMVSALVATACSGTPESAGTKGVSTPDSAKTSYALARAGDPSTGFVVERVWTSDRISGWSPAGNFEVTPDPGHVLIIPDMTANGDSPVTVTGDGLAAAGDGVTADPIGVAPISMSNLQLFGGFVSGWQIVTDGEGRQVKVGRDSEQQPIELSVEPGAMISIVYIVPADGPPFVVSLPGAGGVPLVPTP